MTQVIDARIERIDDVLEDVARVVFGGGTIVFPNDTSYGIACDPYESDAVDRIYAAKGRPDNRPLPCTSLRRRSSSNTPATIRWRSLAAKRLLPAPVIVC